PHSDRRSTSSLRSSSCSIPLRAKLVSVFKIPTSLNCSLLIHPIFSEDLQFGLDCFEVAKGTAYARTYTTTKISVERGGYKRPLSRAASSCSCVANRLASRDLSLRRLSSFHCSAGRCCKLAKGIRSHSGSARTTDNRKSRCAVV